MFWESVKILSRHFGIMEAWMLLNGRLVILLGYLETTADLKNFVTDISEALPTMMHG